MKPTHTPTPWTLDSFSNVYSGKEPVCVKGLSLSSGHNGPANTTFIIRAVNAHEKLIRACRAAADYWHSSSSDMDPCSDENLCLYCSALAEAEGLV